MGARENEFACPYSLRILRLMVLIQPESSLHIQGR
jgi:hypothetical protein